MKIEIESGTLLGIGTAYLPVKEIKGEFYVKVSDFTRCMDSMRKELEEENEKLRDEVKDLVERNIELDKKYMLVLTENKKLKSDLEECECSFWFENDEVGYRKRECKKLREELSKYKEQYQHSLGGDDELIYEEGLYD